MKKILMTTLLSLSAFGLLSDAYAAICPCEAPPSCGQSRPERCPLEAKVLKCEGDINETFTFNESMNPRVTLKDQSEVRFTNNSGGSFFEGRMFPDSIAANTVSYWFGSAYCTLSFSIDLIGSSKQSGWSTSNVNYQCEGQKIKTRTSCSIEY